MVWTRTQVLGSPSIRVTFGALSLVGVQAAARGNVVAASSAATARRGAVAVGHRRLQASGDQVVGILSGRCSGCFSCRWALAGGGECPGRAGSWAASPARSVT